MEGKRLYMATYPGEGLDARRLGEGGRLEGDGKGLEQGRRSACRKVMADETKVGRILMVEVR